MSARNTNSDTRNEALTGTCVVYRERFLSSALRRFARVRESPSVRPSVRLSVCPSVDRRDALADAHLNHSTLGGPSYSSRLRLTMKQSN